MGSSDWIKNIVATPLSDHWGKLTKYNYDMKRRDGTWQNQTREVYDRGNGTTCLLFNPQTGCVLLTRQMRLPIYIHAGLDALIEAPAGMLEGVEDPAERMRQELMEETGFQISELRPALEIFMSPGSVSEKLVFFLGEYTQAEKVGDGGGLYEEGEDIEVMHVPLDTAMEMIKTGEICDGKTVILLQTLWIEHAQSA